MGKRTQTILATVAVVLAVGVIISTQWVDLAAVPIWYWLLMAGSATALIASVIMREWKSVPSRKEIIFNMLIATFILVIAGRVAPGNGTRIYGPFVAYIFLAVALFRFMRLIMLSAKR